MGGLWRDDHGLGAAGAGFDELGEMLIVGTKPALRLGGERVGEDGHAAAADQAVVPAVVVVEAEGEHLGFRFAVTAQGSERLAFDLGLDAAAAEGADLSAVGEDEHGRPGLLRRGAARLDDGAVDAIAAGMEGVVQFGEKFAHDVMISDTSPERQRRGWSCSPRRWRSGLVILRSQAETPRCALRIARRACRDAGPGCPVRRGTASSGDAPWCPWRD